ncbi:MAG: DUF1684 domain-containing protein [Granulicella sp.]
MRPLFLLAVFSLILHLDLYAQNSYNQMSDTPNPELAAPRFLTTQVASTHPDFAYTYNLEKWRSQRAASIAATEEHPRPLRWYIPDLRFRITANWIPSGFAGSLAVPNTLGQITDESSPGMAEFVLYGQTVRLFPIANGQSGLLFLFRDATSKTSTQVEGRILHADPPSQGIGRTGNVVLDFNRAENPPCAYSPGAVCSLPPQQNRLTIPIPAGEQRYSVD